MPLKRTKLYGAPTGVVVNSSRSTYLPPPLKAMGTPVRLVGGNLTLDLEAYCVLLKHM